MHTNPKYVKDWVEYSVYDAEMTYYLRETLAYLLCKLATREEDMGDNFTLYLKYWLPFGELLTDLERDGIKIDVEYLKEIQLKAEKDKLEYEQNFLDWVYKVQSDAHEFNANSVQQMQQLLFAPYNKKGARKSKKDEEEEQK